MEALNKFQENGVTYFQLYIACPIDFEIGRNASCSFWKHGDNECYGDIYVGDNAHFKCIKCGQSAHLKNCRFSCPEHSNSPGSFVSFRRGGASVSICWGLPGLASMVRFCGQQWLIQFIANLGEW